MWLLFSCTDKRLFLIATPLQALMAVRPDLPNLQLWQQRVCDIHATWGGKNLATRDNDITPGVWVQACTTMHCIAPNFDVGVAVCEVAS
jgi:hypothetical protein